MRKSLRRVVLERREWRIVFKSIRRCVAFVDDPGLRGVANRAMLFREALHPRPLQEASLSGSTFSSVGQKRFRSELCFQRRTEIKSLIILTCASSQEGFALVP
ncbi:hypothetical protein CDAR_184081 [Caerostris darwini]|uniref:Uncharacterized protein n=1 Tax=Caerostris darwini TaxID=1538125 RepID=A0AAV4TYE7_9ARAC|nr:hypothetical protein CDAR_184081 [Caerostris darwini]